MIVIKLPLPPRNNVYYRFDNGRAHLSTEARKFKTTVTGICWSLGLFKPKDELYQVEVYVHNRVRIDGSEYGSCADIDAYLKATLDALQGLIYVDDKQVKRLTSEYGAPTKGGGLTVVVTKWSPLPLVEF